MTDDFENKLNKIVWHKPAPRKKRKKILSKKIWRCGGIFLVLLAAAGALFFSPVFKIKKIAVSGNISISSESIESFARSYSAYKPVIFGGGNLLLVSGRELADKLKTEFPKIGEVKVKKDLLKRSLSVEISEKRSIGIWCDDSECFYLERNGVVFERAPFSEGSLILLIKAAKAAATPKLGEKVIEENLLDFLLNVKEGLFSRLKLNTKEFLLKAGSSSVEVTTSEGFKLFFDSQKNSEEQIGNLGILLEEKIKEERPGLEYVDLREGNKIYYKLNENASSTKSF